MGFFRDKEHTPELATPEPAAAPLQAPPQAPSSSPLPGSYGIEQAIALLRNLPAGATDIVVRVVKQTLESAHISLASIIADATRREEGLETRVRTLQEEISSRQHEIATRTAEVARLQLELDDISRTKERLSLR
jgi:hypothetical protein